MTSFSSEFDIANIEKTSPLPICKALNKATKDVATAHRSNEIVQALKLEQNYAFVHGLVSMHIEVSERKFFSFDV